MRRHAPRRHLFDSRGNGPAGMVLVIALLVVLAIGSATLWSTQVAGTASETVEGLICRAGSLLTGAPCRGPGDPPGTAPRGGPAGGAPLPDEAYKPERCILGSTRGETSVTGKIAFVQVGREHGFLRQEFSNGEIRYTLLPGEYLAGIELGVGGGLKLGAGFKLGADLTLNPVSGTYGVGDTWTFDNPAQAAEFERKARESEPLPEPQLTTTSVGRRSGTEAALGIKVEIPGAEDFDLGTGVTAQGETSDKYAVVRDNSKPDDPTYPRTWYVVTSTGTVRGEAKLRGVTGAVSRDWSHSVRIIKDADGNVVEYVTVTTIERRAGGGAGPRLGNGKGSADGGIKGGSRVVETYMTRLPITTRAQRAALARHIVRRGYTPPEQVLLAALERGRGTVAAPGPDADRFERIRYQRGRSWRVAYRGSRNVKEIGAEAKLGLVLGAEYRREDSRLRAVDADYLGAPSDDQRPYLPWPECAGGD